MAVAARLIGLHGRGLLFLALAAEAVDDIGELGVDTDEQIVIGLGRGRVGADGGLVLLERGDLGVDAHDVLLRRGQPPQIAPSTMTPSVRLPVVILFSK